MLAPTTAERLIRLRALLTQGLAAASDTSMTGRHTAVIALDGVCELAMGLAGSEAGVNLNKNGFPGLLNRLKQALPAWDQNGAKAAAELHAARNQVQHSGVLPDQDHLPIWTSETERFVTSLVAAAFGEDLAQVASSKAVEDEELRGHLEAAEQAIAESDFAAAVLASERGFDLALRRFSSSRRGFAPHRSLSGGFEEFRQIDSALDRLDRWLDVSALAADPGEWMWLNALTDSVGRGAQEITEEDARRAMAFALSWILRFESFTARYATAEKQMPAYEQPAIDVEYEKPRLESFEVLEPPVGREGRRVRVRLVEVPPEWEWELSGAIQGLRETVGHFLLRSPERTGFEVTVPETLDPEDVLAAIQTLIEATHERYNQRLAVRREALLAIDAAAQRYRDAIAAAGSEWLGEVRADSHRDGSHGIMIALALPEDVEIRHFEDALSALITGDEHPGRHVSVWDDLLSFRESAIEPERLVPLVEQGLEGARERQRQAARTAEEAENIRRRFAQQLNQLLAD